MNVIQPLLMTCNYLFFGLVGLFGLGFTIAFHEFGHFIFCKIFSVRTPSFSIGFGPKLIKRKIGETEFSLSAIPVGGYVEIAGSAEMGQGDQKDAHSNDAYSFASKPYYQKLLILLGGISFNLFFAYFALSLLFLLGAPKSDMLYPINASPVIERIEPGSPAEKAGLAVGDTIIESDGQSVTSDTLISHLRNLQSKPGQSAHIAVQRPHLTEGKAGEPTRHEFDITLGSQTVFGKNVGSLGIKLATQNMPGLSLVESIRQGINLTNTYISTTLSAFKYMFSKRDVSQAGGPIAIISATMKGACQGFKIFMLLLAIISINLAIFNLIPVPILDGGQLLFYTIEAIVRRPLPIKVKEYIHIASWAAFMVLLVFLSAKDIWHLVTPYIGKIKELLGR